MSNETYFKVKSLVYRLQVACSGKQVMAWMNLKDQWLTETDRSHLFYMSSQLLSSIFGRLSRAGRDKCQWSMSRLQHNALMYRPVVEGTSSKRQSFKLSRMEVYEVVRQNNEGRLTACKSECLVLMPVFR